MTISVLYPFLKRSSTNISIAVVKEKAPAVETDFQGFALSQCGTFLKSEKPAYKSIFDAEIYSCPFDGLRQNARKR